MTNFLAFRDQYRNPFTVAQSQIGAPIHIHDFEMEGKPRLQFLQGGDHVMTKMAVLPAVNNQCERIERSAGSG